MEAGCAQRARSGAVASEYLSPSAAFGAVFERAGTLAASVSLVDRLPGHFHSRDREATPVAKARLPATRVGLFAQPRDSGDAESASSGDFDFEFEGGHSELSLASRIIAVLNASANPGLPAVSAIIFAADRRRRRWFISSSERMTTSVSSLYSNLTRAPTAARA